MCEAGGRRPAAVDLGNGLTELMKKQAAVGSHTFPLWISALLARDRGGPKRNHPPRQAEQELVP